MQRVFRPDYSRAPDKRQPGRRMGAGAVLAVMLSACGPSGASGGNGANLSKPRDGGAGDVIMWRDGQAEFCGQVTNPLSFAPRIADVLIVFDRSGSMMQAFGDGSRYSVEAAILKDLLSSYQGRIRFGFQQFPAKEMCGEGAAASCCAEPPRVAVDFGRADAIARAIDRAAPVDGNTPTAGALRAAGEYFASLVDDVTDRYVLLSTDGHPSCGDDGALAADQVVAGKRVSGPCVDALAAVAALRAQEVKTIVMGVGGGLDVKVDGAPSCLEELARAGGVSRVDEVAMSSGPIAVRGPSFFAAASPAELERTLQRIFGAVTQPSCLLKLTSPPPDTEQVAVFLDGREIPRDATRQNGWGWEPAVSPPAIRVFGEDCKRIDRFQVAEIQIRHGCPPCLQESLCE